MLLGEIKSYNLFAVQMTHCKLILDIDTHKKITSFVEDEYKESDKISCVKGFQFHQNFNGKEELNNCLNIYLKNNFYFEIQNAWLNVLGNDSYNKPHFHPCETQLYSGVYYLSNDNNVITFIKEDQTFEIEPKMFDLLIFPYNLIHYVLPAKRSQKRICYAFNLQKIKKKEK